MRRHTTVVLDDGVVDKLGDLGFTLSGFTQTAVDILLSEGFDDFAMSLKLKMLDIEQAKIEEDIAKTESHLRYLTKQYERNKELYSMVSKNYEDAKVSVYICSLIDKLNTCIITNGYDKDIIEKQAHDIIEEIVENNPGFNLEKHIDRIRKLVS
jgi:hypothetical protein